MGQRLSPPRYRTELCEHPADLFYALSFQIKLVNRSHSVGFIIRHELTIHGVITKDTVVPKVV